MPDHHAFGGPPATAQLAIPDRHTAGHRAANHQTMPCHGLVDEISQFLQAQPPGPIAARRARGPRTLRVLLPYSGSPVADCAIDAMIDFARSSTCEVRVLHIREFEVFRGLRFFVRPRAEALALTHDAVVKLRRHSVAATGIVRSARRQDVARQILAEADASSASMILLGVRQRSGLHALLRQDVLRHLLRRSRCPLIVVKAPSPAQGGIAPLPGSQGTSRPRRTSLARHRPVA